MCNSLDQGSSQSHYLLKCYVNMGSILKGFLSYGNLKCRLTLNLLLEVNFLVGKR
jgi:hypothetical protein